MNHMNAGCFKRIPSDLKGQDQKIPKLLLSSHVPRSALLIRKKNHFNQCSCLVSCAVRFAINWLENSRHSWDYAKSVAFPKAHANSEGILHPWRSCSLPCCLPGMEKPFLVYLAPHEDTLSNIKGTVRRCPLCWHAEVPEKNRLNEEWL